MAKADRLTRELSLRMFWAISAVVFAALCFAVVVYAIQIIRELLPPPRSKCSAGFAFLGVPLLAFGGLLIVSAGPISVISGGQAGEQLFQLMGNDLEASAKIVNGLLRDKQMLDLDGVRGLVTFIAAASKLGVVSVAIAACFVLAAMRREQDAYASLKVPADGDTTGKKEFDGKVDDAKFQFERRVEITVSLLQLTACALVAGVIEVYLFYSMSRYYVDARLQSNVQSFAQSLATASGLVYSGLLCAIYLPLVAGQRAIGRELINSHGGNRITGEGTRFVAQLDDVDPKKAPMIVAILAIFSPLIGAFLTWLAQSLTDHL